MATKAKVVLETLEEAHKTLEEVAELVECLRESLGHPNYVTGTDIEVSIDWASQLHHKLIAYREFYK